MSIISNNTVCDLIKEVSKAVAFNEEDHLYHLEKNKKELASVSSILDRYAPSFDRISTASHVARRDGIGMQEVLESWRIRRDFSAVKGSEFHLYASVFLMENRRIALQTPIKSYVQAFHKFWNDHSELFKIVATEFCVYDEENRLAGTVDCLAQRIDTGEYVIFDWKTNKNIKKKNNFHQYFKAPLDHLDHCEYNRFSLQLSLYRFLIKSCLKLPVKKGFFVHFGENREYDLCDAVPFEKEVKEILKLHQKTI